MRVIFLIMTKERKTEAHHALYAMRSTADTLLTRESQTAATPVSENKNSPEMRSIDIKPHAVWVEAGLEQLCGEELRGRPHTTRGEKKYDTYT